MPDHSGANAILLYTLSPDATSSFKNIKACKERCKGGENFKLVKTNDHYEVDPNDLLRRRRLEQNNAKILNYNFISIIVTSVLLLTCI